VAFTMGLDTMEKRELPGNESRFFGRRGRVLKTKCVSFKIVWSPILAVNRHALAVTRHVELGVVPV
jgi:hypothetical protein